jgi:hypothetical protein
VIAGLVETIATERFGYYTHIMNATPVGADTCINFAMFAVAEVEVDGL